MRRKERERIKPLLAAQLLRPRSAAENVSRSAKIEEEGKKERRDSEESPFPDFYGSYASRCFPAILDSCPKCRDTLVSEEWGGQRGGIRFRTPQNITCQTSRLNKS